MEEVFDQIDEYWSDQRNGEIWLKDKSLKPGTPEYFAQIESARFAYNYYMPEILAFLSGAPGKKFLEVGCGMGMDTGYFAGHGFDVTGVDLAKVHVWLAKKYFEWKGYSGRILQGNAEQLDFEDNTFDCA